MFGSGRIAEILNSLWLRWQHHDKRCAAQSYNYQAFDALLVGDFRKALQCHHWCRTALIQKLKLPALSVEERQHDLSAVCEVERRAALTEARVSVRYEEQVAHIRELIDGAP